MDGYGFACSYRAIQCKPVSSLDLRWHVRPAQVRDADGKEIDIQNTGKKSGEKGKGLAIAGIVGGALMMLFWVVLVIAAVSAFT